MGMTYSQGVGNAFGVDGSGASAGMPGFQPGFQPSPDLSTQGFTETLPGTPPGFQTSWQLAGYDSLEAMKDATDPNWRNSAGSIGMTGMPQPSLTTMNTMAPGAMTSGNLNDYNGNPIGGGFGTQIATASPRPQAGIPQVGFGGKSMPAPQMTTQQMPPARVAPRPAPFVAPPRIAPRVNQGIIPVAQNARQVNALNPFTRLRRR